jgi:hypothetical protein
VFNALSFATELQIRLSRSCRVAAAVVTLTAGSVWAALPLGLRQDETATPLPGLIGAEIGDIRWSGRYLWVATESGLARLEPARASGLLESDWVTFDARHGIGRGSVSALDAHGDEVWAAALYDTTITGIELPTPVGSGLSVSRDGGGTWDLIPNDRIFDVNRPGFARGPTTAIQNPCYGLSVTGATVWASFWAGSTVRSPDAGQTWERALPDGAAEIVYFSSDTAADSLRFLADSLSSAGADPARIATLRAAADSLARQETLHRTFDVLAYGDTVWVGTASGLTRSLDNGRTWRNYRTRLSIDGNRLPGSLPANWVVTLERQLLPAGGSVVWAGCRAMGEGEVSATAYTLDQGETWTTTDLPPAWGLAFAGDLAWATSDDGLLASVDRGATWHAVTVQDDQSRETLRGTFVGVALAGQVVWVGAENGLGRSDDAGQTWRVVRTPVTPLAVDTGQALGEPSLVDSVRTYAAPNPFAPARGEQARIQYALARAARVTIRIYDFASRPVLTLIEDAPREGGQVHGENWDGRDRDGERVANGIYFYRLELDNGRRAFGKVVVLD